MMLKYTGKEKNIIYKETKTVDLTAFLKKHTSAFVRVFGAAVLCAHILPGLAAGREKRVLFAATGALMSQTLFLQGESIPGIAHCVELACPESL